MAYRLCDKAAGGGRQRGLGGVARSSADVSFNCSTNEQRSELAKTLHQLRLRLGDADLE